MSDTTLATLLILTSAFMHACWNAGVKHSEDKLATIIFVTAYGGLLLAPFAVLLPLPEADLWYWIGASMACHLCYQLLLAKALEKNPLNVAYPLARGTGPFIVVLFAFFFLGDTMSLMDILSVGVLVTGIFLTISFKQLSPTNRAALIFPFATGLMIAAYTIVDGLAVKSTDTPYVFIVWSAVASAPLVMIVGLYQRGWSVVAASSKLWRKGLPVAIAAHGGYALALMAYSLGSLGEIAALRETSIIFAGIIGALWLNEPLTHKKSLSLLLIATGAVTLKLL